MTAIAVLLAVAAAALAVALLRARRDRDRQAALAAQLDAEIESRRGGYRVQRSTVVTTTETVQADWWGAAAPHAGASMPQLSPGPSVFVDGDGHAELSSRPRRRAIAPAHTAERYAGAHYPGDHVRH